MKKYHLLFLVLVFCLVTNQLSGQKEYDFTKLGKEIVQLFQNIEKTPLHMDSTIQLTHEELQKILKNNPQFKDEKLRKITKEKLYQIRKHRNNSIVKGEIYNSDKPLTDEFEPTYLSRNTLTHFGNSSKFHSEEIDYCILKVYFYNEKGVFFYNENMLIKDDETYRLSFVDIPVLMANNELEEVSFDTTIEEISENSSTTDYSADIASQNIVNAAQQKVTRTAIQQFFIQLKTAILTKDTATLKEQICLLGIKPDLDAEILTNLFKNDTNEWGDFAISTQAINLIIKEYHTKINSVDDDFYESIKNESPEFLNRSLTDVPATNMKSLDYKRARLILIYKNNKYQLYFWENLNFLL